MKRWLTGTTVAAVGALLATGPLGGTAENPGCAPLISRLADDSFAERERAAGDILELAKTRGGEVQSALANAFRHSPEPEIRFRSKDLLMKIFTESIGYVGVRYGADEFIDEKGVVRRGVRIGQVEPGSPAAAAGLMPMDVVVALNGQPFDPVELEKDFGTKVQLLGVGHSATLKLYRGIEVKEFKITLGTRVLPLTAEQANSLFKARLQDLEKPTAGD